MCIRLTQFYRNTKFIGVHCEYLGCSQYSVVVVAIDFDIVVGWIIQSDSVVDHSMTNGYSSNILDELQTSCRIRSRVAECIVDWNGVIHLKTPSSQIVTSE